MAGNVLSHTVKLIGECFAGILTLHSQNVFERFLFTSENLYLLLVMIQILVELSACLSQAIKFTLEMGSVLRSLCLRSTTISHI